MANKFFLIVAKTGDAENMDNFVWAPNVDEAIKLWRKQYKGWDGVTERVYEINISDPGEPQAVDWTTLPCTEVTIGPEDE